MAQEMDNFYATRIASSESASFFPPPFSSLPLFRNVCQEQPFKTISFRFSLFCRPAKKKKWGRKTVWTNKYTGHGRGRRGGRRRRRLVGNKRPSSSSPLVPAESRIIPPSLPSETRSIIAGVTAAAEREGERKGAAERRDSLPPSLPSFRG